MIIPSFQPSIELQSFAQPVTRLLNWTFFFKPFKQSYSRVFLWDVDA